MLAFTLLFTALSSYLNNMAIFCLPQNCIFDNSNFTSAHIAQQVEHFHGKEEVASSILAVGTIISNYNIHSLSFTLLSMIYFGKLLSISTFRNSKPRVGCKSFDIFFLDIWLVH